MFDNNNINCSDYSIESVVATAYATTGVALACGGVKDIISGLSAAGKPKVFAGAVLVAATMIASEVSFALIGELYANASMAEQFFYGLGAYGMTYPLEVLALSALASIGYNRVSPLHTLELVGEYFCDPQQYQVIWTLVDGVAAPIIEELMMRGALQPLAIWSFKAAGLGLQASRVLGILLTSLIFARLHEGQDAEAYGINRTLVTRFHRINALVAGLVAGVLKEISGGLAAPIGYHFARNLININ